MLGLATIYTFIDAGLTYLKQGREIKAATKLRKDELSKLSLEAKLESIKNAEESDFELDKRSEERIPWADDVSFGVFLLPALLAFWPPAIQHIQAGFTALTEMPVWYQYALGLMLVRVWGYSKLVSPIVQMAAKAYLGAKAMKK